MRWWLWFATLGLGPARADEIDDLLRQARWDDAARAAVAEAEARPGDVAAEERVIDVWLSLGRPDEADARCAALRLKRPDDPDALYLSGRAALDVDVSRGYFEAALRLDPQHARAHLGIGSLLRVRGELRDAAEQYQLALAVDPTLDEAWVGLLACVAPSGDRASILAVAEAATTAAPTAVEAWLTRVAWDAEHAAALLRDAIAAAPDDARLHAAAAEQALRDGDGARALAAADRALELEPGHRGARLARLYAQSVVAGTLTAEGVARLTALRSADPAHPDTRAEADAIVDTWPRSPLPWMSRARLRVSDNLAAGSADPAGARADLEAALRLDPRNEEATAALGLLLVDAEPARAAELLTQATQVFPDDASLRIALARALSASGNGARAVRALEDGVRRMPHDPLLPIALAGQWSAQGDKKRALAVLRDAYARVPDARVRVAQAAAAREAGELREAATIYEELARVTGRADLRDLAARLRAEAASAAAPPP